MAIPTFNNGQGGQSIRVDSLNEAITEVNRLVPLVDDVPDQFTQLADEQRREEFFRTVLQPAGINIPPVHLFWPSSQNDRTQDADIARPGSAFVFDEFGQLVERSADEVLRDYDPATGAFLGALAEPQRENLFAYSQDFDDSYWTKTSANLTTGQLAPDGTETATLVEVVGDGPNRGSLRRTLTLQPGTYTASIYAKSGTNRFSSVQVGGNRAHFDLDAVVSAVQLGQGEAQMENVGDGWYRCSLTVTYVSESSITVRFENMGSLTSTVGSDGDNVFMWQAQIEEGVFASAPIVTDGASIIRPATTQTLPQVGDRRRGFIAWQGVMRFDPDAGAGASDQVRQFPFGRASTEQGVLVTANTRIEVRQPTSVAGTVATIIAPESLQGRLVRVVYWWDLDAGVVGASVDGVSGSGVPGDLGTPPDGPIRFGRAAVNREGGSHTEWAFISYNYPSIEQIEAFTGELAP